LKCKTDITKNGKTQKPLMNGLPSLQKSFAVLKNWGTAHRNLSAVTIVRGPLPSSVGAKADVASLDKILEGI
jgi:hypothetical protein